MNSKKLIPTEIPGHEFVYKSQNYQLIFIFKNHNIKINDFALTGGSGGVGGVCDCGG